MGDTLNIDVMDLSSDFDEDEAICAKFGQEMENKLEIYQNLVEGMIARI